jgi:hypothetical protein
LKVGGAEFEGGPSHRSLGQIKPLGGFRFKGEIAEPGQFGSNLYTR